MTETGYGYCQCGCGRKTAIADQTRSDRGWIKDEPKRFIRGHGTKRTGPPPECVREGCDRPGVARGLCTKHYQQWFKAQDPERVRGYQKAYDDRHPGRRLEQARARYAANPEVHVEYSRRSIVKRKYGLTLEEYEAIIARGCAICGSHKPRMALDHDHANGKIRDALCANCNNGLGRFHDDPARLRAAREDQSSSWSTRWRDPRGPRTWRQSAVRR